MEVDLEKANFGLTLVFAFEMALKMYALGLRCYVRDRFNVFDFTVVAASAIELALSPPSFLSTSAGSSGAATALRTLRLLRIFKLARYVSNVSNRFVHVPCV